MEELLSKQQRGTKEYLLQASCGRRLTPCNASETPDGPRSRPQAVAPVVIEGMSVLAVERPKHPLAWLASYILEHSELGDELAVVRTADLQAQGLDVEPFTATVFGQPAEAAVQGQTSIEPQPGMTQGVEAAPPADGKATDA